MLTDEEIAEKIKEYTPKELTHMTWYPQPRGDEHFKLLKILQQTRQDLRELCLSAKRIPANDIESTESLAKDLLTKYGWEVKDE